ncbi:hypothetical protein P692DRAFT_20780948 [Suillus brevipes Sb2]|nr:hypothetical protein P692DRAFT_20780948 [Suillus brevipes Sb2]
MAHSFDSLDLLHACSKHRRPASGKGCFGFCVSFIFVVGSSIASSSRLSRLLFHRHIVYRYPPGVDSSYAHAKFGKITPRYLSNTLRTV